MSFEDDLAEQLLRDGRLLIGTPMMGCELSESQIREMLELHYPGMPYCLVKDWLLIDLEAVPEVLDYFQRNDLEPRVVFSHCVLRDSRGRFPPGSWVRSTYQVTLDEAAGVFTSCNTVYVLVGQGYRKSLPLGVVMSWR